MVELGSNVVNYEETGEVMSIDPNQSDPNLYFSSQIRVWVTQKVTQMWSRKWVKKAKFTLAGADFVSFILVSIHLSSRSARDLFSGWPNLSIFDPNQVEIQNESNFNGLKGQNGHLSKLLTNQALLCLKHPYFVSKKCCCNNSWVLALVWVPKQCKVIKWPKIELKVTLHVPKSS